MKDIQTITKSKKFMIIFNSLLCLSIFVSSIVIVVDKTKMKNGVVYAGADTTTTTTASNSTQKYSTARLMCAGDNLIHRSIFNQANDRAEGEGYNFAYVYDGVRDIIDESDIAFINQESVMDSSNEPSSYPKFNTPTQVLAELISVGFDVYNQATEHIMDMDVSGIENDLKLFQSKDNIMLTGLYPTREDMLKPQVKSVNGISFSFLGITEYLNDTELPNDSNIGLLYLSDNRYTQDELYATMEQMIQNAKKESDVVCVSMHWKTEENTEPDDSQKQIVAKLLEYGADIIIGTGPHVLQPIEYMKNGDGDQAVVLWSLGNFVSCQDRINDLLGGIADIKVEKGLDNGQIKISAKLIPTITQYNKSYQEVHIVPLWDYSDSLADLHGITYTQSNFNMASINKFYSDMFGDKLEAKLEK